MEKEFKKYTEMENHYRQNAINRYTLRYPEMSFVKYIVTEKLHGANFSINIFNSEDLELKFGKRKSFLEDDDTFMNFQAVMEQEREKVLIESMKHYAKENGIKTLRIYVEIFGVGVQKFDYLKIDTPTKKTIRVFDIYVNGRRLLPIKVLEILESYKLLDMFVPIVGIFDNLQDALDVNTEFRSYFSSDECTYDCEGVVIRPYDTIPYYTLDDAREEPEIIESRTLILKKKNEHFTDKSKAGRIVKVLERSDEFNRLMAEYKSYFTIARVESAFSKEGTITEPSEMGKYIKFISQDIKEDFFKDHFDAFKMLDDTEKTALFKVNGKLLVPMLKLYLKKS